MAEASSGLCQALAPPSPEAGDITSHWVSPGCQRRSLFWCLRRKKPSHGLLEIGPGHELHPLASMMQAGLWAATQVSLKQPPAGPPTEKDFSEVLTQAHKGFELDTLAGPAFAWLRHSLGLAEEDYQDALGPGGPYLQFFSPSKSKSIFFLSHDRRFFLKTQQRREVQVLLAHLPRYVQHLQRHPYTLLTRLLGVHTLRMAQGKKEYFIVMLSVFYPASGRLLELYDIKGCEVDRWVEPVSDDCSIVVLKDLNFQGKTIHLGPQRTWLLYQMELDTAFLRDLNVMDYSLILAFHQHQDGERTEASSLPQASSARFVEGIQNPEEVELPQNYRLLSGGPHAPNILDGPEQRYFLGLVDLATVYGLRRRLEYLWKMLWYSGRNFSTVNPTRYARRLCQWVEAHSD